MRVRDGKTTVGILIETINEDESNELRQRKPNLALAKVYNLCK